MKKILFVINVDWFFISHRLILAENAVKNGYKVTVACKDTGRKNEIEKIGAKFIDFQFDRSSTNPLQEVFTIKKFYYLYKAERPDVIHHITLKPIIYGSIIARILKLPVLNAVSGLGFNFSEDKKGVSTKIMTSLMKLGFANKKLISIFQNNDDLATMTRRGIINESNRVVKIKGAGVDLNKFYFSIPNKKKKVQIILPARLLWDKGIKEFYKAAMLLKHKYKDRVVFKLIGVADIDNKSGVSEKILQKWVDNDYFIWLNYQKNMVSFYTNSDIVVLPSYREGMPKTLLEACAIGRPIITTDAIGCRECVIEGVNGYKVPVKNVETLARKISELIDDRELRIKMGKESRKKAEKEFNVEDVIKKHLSLYKKLTNE